MEEDTTISDAELVHAWRAGDEGALNELFARYRRPLFAFLNRMANGDSAQADDIFQEVWIRVLRKIHLYDERGRFSAWLFQIAANMARGAYRKKRSWLKLFVASESVEQNAECEWDVRPEAEMDLKVCEEWLETALLKLPPEQREVFVLRQNGLSFKEIAEIQGAPLNTALGRMHKAIGNIRKYCDEMR